MTYGVGGKQYIAIALGGGGAYPLRVRELWPEFANRMPPPGTTLIVFALREESDASASYRLSYRHSCVVPGDAYANPSQPESVQAQWPQVKVFDASCATQYCHGSDGKGGQGPRLTDFPMLLEHIRATVREGRSGTNMAPFKDTLEPAQLEAVITMSPRFLPAENSQKLLELLRRKGLREPNTIGNAHLDRQRNGDPGCGRAGTFRCNATVELSHMPLL